VGSARVDAGAGLLSELRLLLGRDAARVVESGPPAGPLVRVPDRAPARTR
jgi:hypothetical protein